MENKHPKTARGRIKDIYGNEVDGDISFDEYWERQHLLESYSNAESVRAKEYRKKWHSDITQIHVKVCAKCGNEECICKYFDEEKDSISNAISKGLFDTPKCNDHTQTKEENGECCQTKIKKE